MNQYTLVIHGGAGTIRKSAMTASLESAYLDGLREALEAGFSILDGGGTAMDAVEEAVRQLEDNILFNAGRGSVFTADGQHEMDAAIMDGRTQKAGAVAAVRNIRNPIKLARSVLENSSHVLLSATGANEFATEQGFQNEPESYFFSAFRHDQWKAVQGSEQTTLDHDPGPKAAGNREEEFGTVGAVACDRKGNLASATSTGGMTNKRFGRVGDTPLIGCGTYANNATCAISCTGHGEYFIRSVAAFDVHALMLYRNCTLTEAMVEVVTSKLPAIGGEGGIIGVDRSGRPHIEFNSPGMYRGFRSSDGCSGLAIYR